LGRKKGKEEKKGKKGKEVKIELYDTHLDYS
jgi:hypothetical protein